MAKLDSGSTFVVAMLVACLEAMAGLLLVPSGWAALASGVLFGVMLIALIASEL